MADVSTPHEDYVEMETRRRLPDTLLEGSVAMRNHQEYLPIEGQWVANPNYEKGTAEHAETIWVGETATAYERRRLRSILDNYYAQTITSLAGRVFSREATIAPSSPDYLKGWARDINLEGLNLGTFAWLKFRFGLHHGLVHVMADMPDVPEGARRSQFPDARPYLTLIPAPNLIGWRTHNEGGRFVVDQVRVKGDVSVPTGDFGEKRINEIRVYRPGEVEIWHEIEHAGDVKYEMMEVKPAPAKIALRTFYTNYIRPFVAYPTLGELAELNKLHWHFKSLADNNATAVLFPMWHLSGASSSEMPLQYGGGKMMISRDARASLTMVESTCKPAELGLSMQRELETKIARAALEPLLAQKAATMTAMEYRIRASLGSSALRAWAIGIKDSMESCLNLMAELDGREDPNAKVDMDLDGGLDMDSTEIEAIHRAREIGDLSQEDYLHEISARIGFRPGFNIDENMSRTDKEKQIQQSLPATPPPPAETTTLPE